jgi:hypothetical protein
MLPLFYLKNKADYPNIALPNPPACTCGFFIRRCADGGALSRRLSASLMPSGYSMRKQSGLYLYFKKKSI